MHNANEGLVVVGMVIAVWGLLSHYGIAINRAFIIDKYSRNNEILDEKGLLRHDFLFRILLGGTAIAIGIIEQYHMSLPITIAMLVVAFLLIMRWEKAKKATFLKPKDPEQIKKEEKEEKEYREKKIKEKAAKKEKAKTNKKN